MKDADESVPDRSRRVVCIRTMRFISIGGASTVVYWVALFAGVALARVPPIVVSIVAYGAGFLMAYYGHRNFTYRSIASVGAELPRFLVVHLLCFTFGNLAFWYAEAQLGTGILLAGAVFTGISFSISYAAAEFWVFSEAKQRPPNRI